MANTEHATRYREIKRLGAGGMATVTLAEDTVLGRLVALKRVYGTGDVRGMLRLKREAMVGASLNHPNLVFVYDAQLEDGGDVVIVMEYVEGETLADAISAREALPPPEALRVLDGVAAALDEIHERGIVHRDVKPANVLLGDDGAVKLADLGVADVADRTRITSSDAVVGSFSYMAPEQLEGAPPTPAMDIYALSAVAYEIFSGERARPESNPLALAHAISTQPPPDLRRAWPAAPPATADTLRRGMSADPTERPATAGQLVRRLKSSLDPALPTQSAPAPDRQVTPAAPVPQTAPPPRSAPPPPAPRKRPLAMHTPRRRRSLIVPTLLTLATLIVAGVAVAALSSGGANPPRAGTSAQSDAGTTHRGTTTTTSRSTSTNRNSPTATSSSTTAPPPASAPASAAAAPQAAVEQFYRAAADHQYAVAWALADPNLRTQLGGYSSFQNTFGSVRSITFHSAQVRPGSSGNGATVALRTTSVQTDRTQECAGTARTVRNGRGWLLDRISIDCS